VVSEHFPGRTLDDPTVSNWINALEQDHELVVYVADETLTAWTQKAIRQADQVLIVVSGEAQSLNPVEAFALSTHPPSRRRLVRVHERRVGLVTGTAEWLRERDVAMHHHVALEDDRDVASLWRFLTGRAVGFVAAGGGGLGSAHLGVYKAFAERGVVFDILGGVSVGAAMMAGFALLASAEDIDRGTEDIFVTSRGFKRRTFPRYALLDHLAFDDALRRQYRGAAIEDAWKPYFAVATALDGSGDGLHIFRRGPLWKAVRASGSIPAVLPPVFTEDGLMLVDGGVVDNIPLRPMKAIKAGPNLIVHFGVRESRFAVDYASIPGRGELLRRMLTPGGRRKLPAIPGPIGVLQRCLVLNEHIAQLPLDAGDLVLPVPAFAGANFMDFESHSAVVEAAYRWCRAELDRLSGEDNPALAAMLAFTKP
jgi:NTE family protein